ncbi:hypothetical protein [Haladaptatus halobius]|uniref:hypothetical protein n=1 Tax=Haladaptatus halobius TaxID=2884875 RepID=UPI001D0BCFD7|nr:hypothetical protein [Haladaptatus halobius]
MTEFKAPSKKISRVDFETVVENAKRDATELFNNRNPTEFTSIDEAKDVFVSYALDMYAIQAVSIDEIRAEPSRPRQAITHRATQVFDTYYANSTWDSPPKERS